MSISVIKNRLKNYTGAKETYRKKNNKIGFYFMKTVLVESKIYSTIVKLL